MNGRFGRRLALGAAGLMLVLSTSLSAQAPAEAQNPAGVHIRPGLGVEYFNRLITWDDEAYTSKVKALLFTFNLEVEPVRNFSLNLVLGYSLANFDGLVFRQMPFSVDLEAGFLSGMLLGGGLKQKFVVSSEFEMDLEAQFVTYLGSKSSWDIRGLNEDGILDGKPTWYRVQAGPVFWYKGFMYFSPYLRVSFDKLWGTFHAEEGIGPLEGLEDKAISGRGLFSAALGTLFEPTSGIGLKGEIFVLPRSGGLDYGAQGRLIFSF
jgi:hypothetical protein